MHRMLQITVSMVLGLALCPVAADEAQQDPVAEYGASPRTRLLAETMLAELDYASRARLFHPAEATLFANESLRPFADVDFDDGGILSRLRKLRGVSLLTVAEVGDSRLFLGVDDDGIVGLHFGAFLGATNVRHLELLRMPYLARQE